MRPSLLILIVAIVVSLIGFNVWNWTNEDVWFKCQALTMFFLVWAFERYVDKRDRVIKSILSILWWWMLGNVYDEFRGDPLTWSWNELVFALLALASGFFSFHGVRFHHLWYAKKRGIKYLLNVWRKK